MASPWYAGKVILSMMKHGNAVLIKAKARFAERKPLDKRERVAIINKKTVFLLMKRKQWLALSNRKQLLRSAERF